MRKTEKIFPSATGPGPGWAPGLFFCGGGARRGRQPVAFLLTVTLVVLAAAGLGAEPANDRVRAEALDREAMSHYAIRTEEEMAAALDFAEQAARACPNWVEPHALVCELCCNISDRVPNSRKEWKLAMFARAEAAGDKALALDPQNPGALYWKTLSLAGAADLRGWADNLWLYPTFRANMDRIDVLDPHYYYGGTKRFWVEVLNRVPLFLAGCFGYQAEDIAGDLAAEVRREPRYFCNYTYLARLYWKMGEKDKALNRLNYILRHDPFALYASRGENIEHQLMACRLWKEYTGREHPQTGAVALWSRERSFPAAPSVPGIGSGTALAGGQH